MMSWQVGYSWEKQENKTTWVIVWNKDDGIGIVHRVGINVITSRPSDSAYAPMHYDDIEGFFRVNLDFCCC